MRVRLIESHAHTFKRGPFVYWGWPSHIDIAVETLDIFLYSMIADIPVEQEGSRTWYASRLNKQTQNDQNSAFLNKGLTSSSQGPSRQTFQIILSFLGAHSRRALHKTSIPSAPEIQPNVHR